MCRRAPSVLTTGAASARPAASSSAGPASERPAPPRRRRRFRLPAAPRSVRASARSYNRPHRRPADAPGIPRRCFGIDDGGSDVWPALVTSPCSHRNRVGRRRGVSDRAARRRDSDARDLGGRSTGVENFSTAAKSGAWAISLIGVAMLKEGSYARSAQYTGLRRDRHPAPEARFAATDDCAMHTPGRR